MNLNRDIDKCGEDVGTDVGGTPNNGGTPMPPPLDNDDPDELFENASDLDFNAGPPADMREIVKDAVIDAIKNAINPLVDEVNNLKDDIQSVKKDLEELNCSMRAQTKRDDYVRRLNMHIWPFFPKLFNTQFGLYGWMPVVDTFEKKKVDDDGDNKPTVRVIVSILETAIMLVTNNPELDKTVVIDALRHQLNEFKTTEVISAPHFEDLMKKTIWRTYKVSPKKKNEIADSNAHAYVVVDESRFRQLLQQCRTVYGDDQKLKRYKMPPEHKHVHVDKCNMRQQFALVVGEKDYRFCANSTGGKAIPTDAAERPAFGVPMWREAFALGTEQFFDVTFPKGDESFKTPHVLDGSTKLKVGDLFVQGMSVNYVRSLRNIIAYFVKKDQDQDETTPTDPKTPKKTPKKSTPKSTTKSTHKKKRKRVE